MIVEHVDVRKEEREGRQPRRREEKRARVRKSSRGSVIEVASVNSTTSPFPHTDSGFPFFGSRSSTSRPISVLTSPMEAFPRGTQSNASLEALSMVSAGAASPNRRTRFFGMRNLSTGFRSSDSLAPSGFSGSMVDMQCVPLYPCCLILANSFPLLASLCNIAANVRHILWLNRPINITLGKIARLCFLNLKLNKSPGANPRRGRV
jgi:hypothetical protein